MQQELIQFKQEDSKAPFTIKSEIQIQKQKEQDIEIQNLYRMIDKGIDYYNNGQFTFAKVVLYKSSSTLLNQIKKNQISEKEKPPLIKGIIEGQKQLYSWICHMLNQIQYNYLVMKNCNCNWIIISQKPKHQAKITIDTLQFQKYSYFIYIETQNYQYFYQNVFTSFTQINFTKNQVNVTDIQKKVLLSGCLNFTLIENYLFTNYIAQDF
ncbi:unnamed protein product [Paramecium sonneborni]|uniref:Uncharacterized protein n=1 Tax=Paramecium sonneborni TaxID=65129 RepID=A0A8S1KN22_9CILI|nr:unnamed protein product [Paramecium sonneborni]